MPLAATINYPEELPICARRAEIVAALQAHQVLVVAGETGSGKTTQLPKMCLEAGLAVVGRIGCTQPRRVAALSVSRRVAEELGVTWGQEVGCKMRFKDDTSPQTRVKFMTDGILLAEIQSDPQLRAYSALILDEAHERSLNIDFLLGHLQGLLQRRRELKLLITSATIDTEIFSKAFGGAPVIEVSGRLFPVEIRYAPVESHALAGEAPDELGYIDAAVRATEDALLESDAGDVLVFMPTERDIRDTREALEASLGAGYEVIGLFGRMPAGEQERIFTPGPRRRVVVATNLAETSLTLPRIRYVIDSGLARMSRYNPRTRTKRLPVELVSQSSAQQRSGRAGRVQDGICVRLYSEEDFAERPRFTQPEIQRANLAEVILRMKAFRLGEVETFPFLNPPPAAAIRAGYRLLHELGALDETNGMTAVGQELARLPIDPTLGRMLLQARHEGALPEMLIIAAGLSVPDPRERPEEQKEAAATAHQAFADPESDFLGLLKIWRAGPDAQTRTPANALRRFCKANFLSASRLREWRDVFRQLAETVQDAPAPTPPPPARLGAAARRPKVTELTATEGIYTAIHRSILSGLLGQIAQRQERNVYKAAGERLVTLFPGSNLYERREKVRRHMSGAAAEKSRQPAWIMAGEIVETSQLFARTAARIDPEWVIEIGAHLCQYRYSEPHWSAKAARVLVLERVLVHGLEISRRQVDYGRVNVVEATELFIRGALVAGEARLPHRFFRENQAVREKIETALTRVRSRRAHDLDEALYQFYAARIEKVSSVHDLDRLLRERLTREPDFLCATEADLIGEDRATYDPALFPDQVALGQTALPITYAYTPGAENDGVTVRVPLPMAEQLTTGQLQWMVPGLREEQISVLLRALPKAVRKPLMPLESKVREIARQFAPGRGDFLEELAAYLTRHYRVPVTATDWARDSLPAHLQPRIEVIDRTQKVVMAGRDLAVLQSGVESREDKSDAWERAARQWEKPAVELWSFGDLPESIVVEEVGGAPLFAYPGLRLHEQAVEVRLFRRREEVERAAPAAVRRLAERVLARDLARVWKELAGLAPSSAGGVRSAAGFHSALDQVSAKLRAPSPNAVVKDVTQKAAYEHLLGDLLLLEPALPLTAARFRAHCEKAQRELPLRTHQLKEATRQILALRQTVLAAKPRYAGFEEDLQRLVSDDFLERTPPAQLAHVPRYLRAVAIRAERASLQPGKDAEKARQLLPFRNWETRVPLAQRETFRWLLEEFRVSLFAQELGTAQPVSAVRLKALGGW